MEVASQCPSEIPAGDRCMLALPLGRRNQKWGSEEPLILKRDKCCVLIAVVVSEGGSSQMSSCMSNKVYRNVALCSKLSWSPLVAWSHLQDLLALGPFLKFQASVSNTQLVSCHSGQFFRVTHSIGMTFISDQCFQMLKLSLVSAAGIEVDHVYGSAALFQALPPI